MLLTYISTTEGKGVPLSREEEGEQYDSCRADDEASMTSEQTKVIIPMGTGEPCFNRDPVTTDGVGVYK